MDSSYYYKYLKYKQKYIELINNLDNNLIGGKPGKDGKVDKSYKLGKSAEGAAAADQGDTLPLEQPARHRRLWPRWHRV